MTRRRPIALVALTFALVSQWAAPVSAAEAPHESARLANASLEHGRFMELETQRGHGRALGSFFLVGGPRALGLDDLNHELERNGYSTVGTRTMVGLGGDWIIREGLLLGVLFEGAPGTIRSNRGIEGRVGFAAGQIEAGWSVYRSPALVVYPFLGLGVSRLLVAAKTRDAASAPLRLSQVGPPSTDFDFIKALGTLDVGVGAQTIIALSDTPARRSGPAVGVQLGYSLTFAESGWVNRDDTSRGPFVGPSGAVSGPYARLLLGYSWDRYDVARIERPVEACTGRSCELVCDPGFANCNADARDGCETLTGTPENCGGCGDSCSVANGFRECLTEGSLHVCGPRICVSGFADCNGLLSDGCEASLATDVDHCGTCSVACAPGERCEAGACIP